MTVRTPRLLVLRSAEQIGIVTHPLRLEIVEALQLHGPDSIAGLGRRLERRANALTYHVRLLEQSGVLVQKGARRVGRRDEAVYAAAAPHIALAAGATSQPLLRAAARSAAAAMRMAEREVRRAIEEFPGESARLLSRLLGRRQKAWLTTADVAALHRRLERLGRFLESCHRRRRGQLHALTLVLVPLGPDAGARRDRRR